MMTWIKTNWRVAAWMLLGLAFAAFLIFQPALARAADLGGNCCGDLEERIAELEATTARKGNTKVSVTVYGQVNKAILWVDGDQRVIDQTGDETRLGVTGTAKINATMKAGYVIEFSTNIEEFDVPNPLGIFDRDLSVRRSALWLDTEMGRVTLGLFDTATHEIAELTTANTEAAAKSLNFFGFAPFAGPIQNVVRYDSPTLNGFVVSASWGADNEAYDVALRYYGEFSGFKIVAGIGYGEIDGIVSINDVFRDELVSGSASVMHITTGLFLTGAMGVNDGDSVYQLTGGIERKWWDIGRTTLFVEWANLDDLGASEDAYGLGIVQAVDNAALDLYISYRSIENEDFVLTGARINF